MSDGGWSDADWDDDDWEESRAEVDAALTQIAPPSIDVEAAGAERLRRLEALKSRSVCGQDSPTSAAVPPPLVAGPTCERTSAEVHQALSESDGNTRVGDVVFPPRVRGPDEEHVQYKFYASGGRYEGPLDPVTSQPQGEFGVFYYVCGHRYEGPWEQGEKHGERGTFYCAIHLRGAPPLAHYTLSVSSTCQLRYLDNLHLADILPYAVANGSRYEGGWSHNKRHGLGVQFSPAVGGMGGGAERWERAIYRDNRVTKMEARGLGGDPWGAS
jgi:hypothetical protein